MKLLTIHRRCFLGGGVASLLASNARAKIVKSLVVYKTRYCGCCKAWVSHMTSAGFQPIIHEVEDLASVRARYGVPDKVSSCHTAVIGGYVIEGHVPSRDVERLLRERPKALGIVLPGMPLGSPGMEAPNRAAEKYKTLLLLDRSGRTRVFAAHGS
jgi:hypothetical protein